ncbi:glycine N-acyltransferase-like protein [Ictalurus furcatus]|uniref:glycine N-acyltransferase-like protein n=1 Tax=Ictalurus furcatus TaxID=66913 RepID=UPI00234FCBE9|nr:glycine N-acyltransferase-like protein [Ictalurus furcatus]
MKVLSIRELKKAEEILRHYFPQSEEAYGYVFLMNRVEVDPTDVLVDQWPDFSVLLVKPKRKQKADFAKEICIFTKNESSLRASIDILDWKEYLNLSVDVLQEEMIKAVALNKGVPMKEISLCHLMSLQDPSNLTLDRSFQVSSVKESLV